MRTRPHIEGKMPGVDEKGKPSPIKPGETMEAAAKRLGIQTAEQAQKDLENQAWEEAELRARRQAAEDEAKKLAN